MMHSKGSSNEQQMSLMGLRAAIYARVSSKEQEDEHQVDLLLEFCRQNALRLEDHHVYREKVSGGGDKTRFAFLEMMKAAARGEFDILVFWSYDRLTREGGADLITYLNRLQKMGVHYHCVKTPQISTMGRYKVAMEAFIGEFHAEWLDIHKSNVKRGINAMRKKGATKNGNRYGGGRAKCASKHSTLIRANRNNEFISAMARSIGVSRPAIYHYFKQLRGLRSNHERVMELRSLTGENLMTVAHTFHVHPAVLEAYLNDKRCHPNGDDLSLNRGHPARVCKGCGEELITHSTQEVATASLSC